MPADRITPLAAYGSMYWARRKALQRVVDAGFQPTEFPENDAYIDGSLAHVLERLVAYSTYASGFYARTVQTIASAEFSDLALQTKLALMDRVVPASATEQLEVVRSVEPFSIERTALQIYSSMVRVSPRAGKLGKHVWKGGKALKEALTGRPSRSR